MVCSAPGFSLWDFPGENTGMVCHFFLQGILLTQIKSVSPAPPAMAGGFFTTWSTWHSWNDSVTRLYRRFWTINVTVLINIYGILRSQRKGNQWWTWWWQGWCQGVMELALGDILSWVLCTPPSFARLPRRQESDFFLGYFPKVCFLASNLDGWGDLSHRAKGLILL